MEQKKPFVHGVAAHAQILSQKLPSPLIFAFSAECGIVIMMY